MASSTSTSVSEASVLRFSIAEFVGSTPRRAKLARDAEAPPLEEEAGHDARLGKDAPEVSSPHRLLGRLVEQPADVPGRGALRR